MAFDDQHPSTRIKTNTPTITETIGVFERQIKLLTEALRYLEAKTVGVTGRAVVLRLGVFTVAVAAIHAFRHVVD